MEYIKNKDGTIAIAIDEQYIYYPCQKPDTSEELNEIELFESNGLESVELKYIENGNGRKLFTLLEYQNELELISDSDYILEKLKKINSTWSNIITSYEKSLRKLNRRIVLLEKEGSGPASSWNDILYLVPAGKTFQLWSCRYPYMSAEEIIENYGLEDSEYWDQVLDSGESIEASISDINSGETLRDGIISILNREEQWNLSVNEIEWDAIIQALLRNKISNKNGSELRKCL